MAQVPNQNNGQQYYRQNDSVMKVGSWIGTLLLSAIPIAGFILLLVWAFDSSTNLNKKNYARAVLILTLIGIAFWLIFGVVLGFAAALFSRMIWY